jgi:DNA-binding XRE family transcriptional regulator
MTPALPLLRELRELRGLFRQTLAAAAGVSVDTIQRAETGYRCPGITLHVARQLAAALDCPLGLLCAADRAEALHACQQATALLLLGYEARPVRGQAAE